jgi:hypothetical protein
LLACNATAAGIPELRPEGYTELVGDITISCTGGPDYAVGSQIPTTNITVFMSPQVPITSRFLTTTGSSTGASEALLIIDEAGSNIPTGAPGYGPQAPQVACSTSQQTASGGSACPAYVGSSSGYLVAVNGPTSTTPAANIYQGQIGANGLGAWSVTFFAVPVLPPATSGVSRTFRITNIRVPVPGGTLTGILQASVSTSPSTVLPVSGVALNIGQVGSHMTATVNSKPKISGTTIGAFNQCTATGGSKGATPALAAQLIYTEGFATAFKTRVVPMSNTSYAAEGTNFSGAVSTQNIPGGLYGGFAQNSESGFIFPGLATNNTSTGAVNYTAGLADFGTRLKAVFYNVPAGLTLYVSTTSASQGTAFVPGGTSVLPYAVLVNTGTGDDNPDSSTGNGGNPFGGSSSSFPIAATGTGTDGLGTYPLTATTSTATTGPSNSAVAVWEVVNANPSAQDVLTFSVYVAYTAAAPTTTNPEGTPITGTLNQPVPDVQMYMTPDPNAADFSTANASQNSSPQPTPRFADAYLLEGNNWLTISLCQTTLLYPYVITASGFDTGLAVANTSTDPFGTTNQTGSCKLYPYGVTVATAGNTTYAGGAFVGCDTISNPASGTNCFPVVPSGQVMAVDGVQMLPNFQGYIIAVCNFQFAHGYAAVSDLGLRNFFSGYLAEELSTAGVGANSRGTSNGGVQGIESLIH